MTEPRFTDEEVSLILRKAMEADHGRGETGLTLAQLKEIAGEVGIDPVRVESAALAVRTEGMTPAAGPLGLRTTTRYEVEVGTEVSSDQQAELIRIIRTAMGRKGVATEEFGALEWKARDAFGGRYVTIRSQDGRTRVEGLGNFRDGAMVSASAGGTAGLALAAMVMKATVGGLTGLGLAGPLALVAGAALPAAVVYRRWFKKEDEALRAAVAEISAQIEAQGAANRSDGDADPER